VLNMSRDLEDSQLFTFIDVASAHIVEQLIEKAQAPVFDGQKQWPYSSYRFLCRIDKYAKNRLMCTVGQEKMLELTDVLCDRITSEFIG